MHVNLSNEPLRTVAHPNINDIRANVLRKQYAVLSASSSFIVGTYLDFVIKYVLWDEVLDWERDIKDYGKVQRLRL